MAGAIQHPSAIQHPLIQHHVSVAQQQQQQPQEVMQQQHPQQHQTQFVQSIRPQNMIYHPRQPSCKFAGSLDKNL